MTFNFVQFNDFMSAIIVGARLYLVAHLVCQRY